MAFYGYHMRTHGIYLAPVLRGIIIALDLANIVLLSVTVGLYYTWVPRHMTDWVPFDWTDPLVILAVFILPRPKNATKAKL